ncbi:ABC transporter transmembrane domain-containing protein [Enterococcus sp. AZ109]|uniref:ABC transporter transmembrane domain-containing protein n=1 Tax=Enterococcus sp. AZ109 TaxID=2774634 RepID=UPI003F274558
MKKVIKNHQLLLICTLLFSILSSVTAIYAAFLLRDILNAAITQDSGLFRRTIWLTVLYLPVIGILQWTYSYFSKKFIYHVVQDLRQEIFDGILTRDASTFHSTNSADYISAVTNDNKILEDNYLIPLLDTPSLWLCFCRYLDCPDLHESANYGGDGGLFIGLNHHS